MIRASFRIATIGLLSLCVAPLLVGCSAVDDGKIPAINLAQVKALKQVAETKPLALLLIDPRPQEDFEKAHIPGARNLTLTFFDGNKAKDPRIEQFEIVVVYGDDPGSRIARAVVKRMIALDHSDARFFSGGLQAWKAAKLPLDSGPSMPLPVPEQSARRSMAR